MVVLERRYGDEKTNRVRLRKYPVKPVFTRACVLGLSRSSLSFPRRAAPSQLHDWLAMIELARAAVARSRVGATASRRYGALAQRGAARIYTCQTVAHRIHQPPRRLHAAAAYVLSHVHLRLHKCVIHQPSLPCIEPMLEHVLARDPLAIVQLCASCLVCCDRTNLGNSAAVLI